MKALTTPSWTQVFGLLALNIRPFAFSLPTRTQWNWIKIIADCHTLLTGPILLKASLNPQVCWFIYALRMQSLSHWTTTEVPCWFIYIYKYFSLWQSISWQDFLYYEDDDLQNALHTHMYITVLYHREVTEGTLPRPVSNRNKTIYSNEMQTIIFFCLPVDSSGWVNFLLITADAVSSVFHWHSCKGEHTKWEKLNKV